MGFLCHERGVNPAFSVTASTEVNPLDAKPDSDFPAAIRSVSMIRNAEPDSPTRLLQINSANKLLGSVLRIAGNHGIRGSVA